MKFILTYGKKAVVLKPLWLLQTINFKKIFNYFFFYNIYVK